jgi:DNA polymerase I
MQLELFDVLSKARSQDEIREAQPLLEKIREKYMVGLGDADIRELSIRRRLSRVNYSRRCAEASAVKAYQKLGFSLAPGMEIGYVIKDAAKWEVDAERDANGFDEGYYGKLLQKAWAEISYALHNLPS